MELYIRCFSGTGNSLAAARWMAEEAEGTSTVEMIGTDRPGHAPAGSLQGLCFPTHGFTAPWAVLRYILRMPSGRGASIFSAATRGVTKIGPFYLSGAECSANLVTSLLLRAKGYRVLGLTGIDMPQNWTVIFPSLKPEHVNHIFQASEAKTRSFTRELLTGKKKVFTPENLWMALVGAVLLPVSLAYLVMARLILGKLFFTNGKCNGCGVCAASCPTRSIVMVKNRPWWKFGCEHCMRCLNRCPRQAVEAGQQTLIILAALSLVPISPLAVRLASPLGLEQVAANPGVSILLSAGFLILASFLLSALIWCGGLFPPFRTLWTRTTPSHWYRRYKAPGVTLGDLNGDEKKP